MFRLAVLLVALAGPALLSTPAAAQPVEIDIDQAQVQPLPIALPAFGGGGSIGAEMVTVIAGDLERSGFFRPTPNAGGVEPDLTVAVQPSFDAWRATGAAAMLNGAVTVDPDGRLRVDVRLWDVPNQSQLLGTQFTSTRENWRRVAHKVADAVYEKLTGEKGYFDTRIVFVAESGPKVKRVKRLTIMDQDGANPSFLTDGGYLVLTPRFSASDQEVTYMALRPQGSSLYVLNIETGRQETLGAFQGMVSAPRFSPDGRRVAFSLEKNGNSDLWSMDLRTRQQTRLTADPAIDTSPSYSPDGDRLAFNSDRGGQPQLYVMAAGGGGARRISFGTGRYTTPVWSPKGDWIAFTKQSGARFSIGVMRPDGSEERLLTNSVLDEGPTWAPNGRVLMFTRETGGGPKLWTVDLTGRVERAAAYPGQASDPAWSPLLN